MSNDVPILVTGASGRLGGVGGTIVEMLRRRDLPVRALVLRRQWRGALQPVHRIANCDPRVQLLNAWGFEECH